MQKFVHNAVSYDSPEHFRVKHSVVNTDKLMISRKKQVHVRKVEDFAPRNLCNSLPPMNYERSDQDLDSIRFSDREAVQQGLKNSVRYKSNFFKLFYGHENKLFKKPSKEITYLQPIQKVTRNDASPAENLKVQKSIRRLREAEFENKEVVDIDPGNKLLNEYEQQDIDCKSPQSTSIKFWKRSLPKLEKVASKINCMKLDYEIKDFEARIPAEKNKGSLWFKNLKFMIND